MLQKVQNSQKCKIQVTRINRTPVQHCGKVPNVKSYRCSDSFLRGKKSIDTTTKVQTIFTADSKCTFNIVKHFSKVFGD